MTGRRRQGQRKDKEIVPLILWMLHEKVFSIKKKKIQKVTAAYTVKNNKNQKRENKCGC